MAKIKVDHNKCVACGTCYAMFPQIFEAGPEGKSQVKDHDYEKYHYTKEQIEGVCPVGAISIDDE